MAVRSRIWGVAGAQAFEQPAAVPRRQVRRPPAALGRVLGAPHAVLDEPSAWCVQARGRAESVDGCVGRHGVQGLSPFLRVFRPALSPLPTERLLAAVPFLGAVPRRRPPLADTHQNTVVAPEGATRLAAGLGGPKRLVHVESDHLVTLDRSAPLVLDAVRGFLLEP